MIDSKDTFLSELSESHTDAVMFFGHSSDFPDVMLRIIEAEFQGVRAIRSDDFETPVARAPDGRPKLLIIDERLIEYLVTHYENIQRRFPGADLVFSYRDVKRARCVFNRQQSQGKFPGLRFMPSNASVVELISMFRLLLAGDFIIPADLLISERSPLPPPPTGIEPELELESEGEKLLTPRENEVLELVAYGHRNKNIATRLQVSEHTVKLHIHHIFAKLGVNNRTAATNWYLARGRIKEALHPGS